MRISILIVSYNACAELRRCLDSLRGSGAQDVVVVDNASPDGSAAMVRREFPQVLLLEHSANLGFSAAVNAAAAVAQGDAFLLLNPDAELPAGGLAAMGRAFASQPDAWAMGFRQVDQHGFFQLAVGPRPTLPAEFVRRLVQRRLDARSHWVARLVDRALWRRASVPWVAGSSLLVWRHAFARIGGFDERYFLYFEDIDFCLRLSQAGGQVYYEPGITVMHRRGVSAANSNGNAERAYRASQLQFWERHRGPVLRWLVQGYLQARGVA